MADDSFTSPELADSAVFGDSGDSEGDYFISRTEIVLGREPRVAESAVAGSTAVQNVSVTNFLFLTFRLRAPALEHGDGTDTVTYRDAVASESASSCFLRVLVIRMRGARFSKSFRYRTRKSACGSRTRR